jgi:hypothetical protein
MNTEQRFALTFFHSSLLLCDLLCSPLLSLSLSSHGSALCQLIDPFEETPRHVASLLKTDLRLRFESLLDANKKSSHAKATAQLQEILEKVKATSTTATATKPPAPASLQTASHKLESYRSLLLLIQDSPPGEAGPMGEFFSPLLLSCPSPLLLSLLPPSLPFSAVACCSVGSAKSISLRTDVRRDLKLGFLYRRVPSCD